MLKPRALTQYFVSQLYLMVTLVLLGRKQNVQRLSDPVAHVCGGRKMYKCHHSKYHQPKLILNIPNPKENVKIEKVAFSIYFSFLHAVR